MRVLLFAGKGGVGKTSLALATALAAAEHGHRSFVLSTDAAHSLGDALGRRVGPRPLRVAHGVTAQEVAPLAELERSWSAIGGWLQALLGEPDSLAVEELLVAPGLEELVALRALCEVEASGDYDLCIVDCAPTGGALRLLRLPDLLRQAMDGLWGWQRRTARLLRPLADRVGAGHLVAPEEALEAFERLFADVDAVRQILLDEDRSSARLVVNPTRVVMQESRRTLAYLGLYGIASDAVVANRLLPNAARTGTFARWAERERAELAALEGDFPLPLLRAPLLPREPIGAEALAALGRAVYGERDPADVFVRRRPVRLARREGLPCLEIDLPTASQDEVDVWVRGEDLCVGVRDAQRRFALPASLSGRPIERARWSEGVLEVRFGPRAPGAPADGATA